MFEVLNTNRILSNVPVLSGEPQNTVLVTLPEVSYNGEVLAGIRLGMHTDTTGNLLRVLRGLACSGLYIEGRVLTPEQQEVLSNHSAYRFYMNTRLNRFRNQDNQEVVALTTPKDLNFSQEEVHSIVGLAFSPAHLMDEVGHSVGFYDVEALLEYQQSGATPSDFLPLFGGCNEFRIGSNLLPRGILSVFARRIERELKDLDLDYGQISSISFPLLNSGFSNVYSLPTKSLNFNKKTPFNSMLKLDTLPLNNILKDQKIINNFTKIDFNKKYY